MSHLWEFLGHFHPLLVHLPIGILVIALLFVLLRAGTSLKIDDDVITLLFGVSAICAVLSCVTGLLLAGTGDYDSEGVKWHKWMGLTLAFLSIVLWIWSGKIVQDRRLIAAGSLVTFIVLMITGHLGGSLTHGEDYLSQPLADWVEGRDGKQSVDFATINFKAAGLYKDVVTPVLQGNCYTCHNDKKQRGKLRLDQPELIMKGGKDGKVVVPGSPEESEIIRRILLPLEDEDHMPPKERPQLTKQEIAWLTLWVESGADFAKPIAALASEEQLASLMRETPDESAANIPEVAVGEPNSTQIEKFEKARVSIAPIAKGMNFLEVNFISVPEETNSLLADMKDIAPNVVSLKLSGTKVDDQGLQSLRAFKNLTRLSLSNTMITDAGLASVGDHAWLSYLNLMGTNITIEGIKQLKSLPKLRYLFLYKTKVKREDEKVLREMFPAAGIDFGDYEVPFIASDTVIIRLK